MPPKIPTRLVWAVEMLAVDPADRLLEIGCGGGVAVSLICDRLISGRITAIDRSEAMVKTARARNSAHVASGKAAIWQAALHEADFGDEGFNKILAVNVNLFWID